MVARNVFVNTFIILIFISHENNGQNILEGVRNADANIDVAHLLDGQNIKKPDSKIDRILSILEGLQKQVNRLKSSVNEIQKLQADLNATRHECKANGGEQDFIYRIKVIYPIAVICSEEHSN